MTRQTSPFGLGHRTQRWLPDLTAKMIPLREGLDPLQMLTSASQVAEWQNERLPSDQISIENGGIITQVCARLPHATASREVATAASRRMKQKKQVDAHTNSQIYCPVLRLISPLSYHFRSRRVSVLAWSSCSLEKALTNPVRSPTSPRARFAVGVCQM